MYPGQNNRPIVTGKPLDLGGSPGRETATAQGLFYVFEYLLSAGALPDLTDLSEMNVAIQGFENAGRNAARIFAAAGARIVAVSDNRGGIFDNGYQTAWAEARPGAPPLPRPTLRTAAHVVAVRHCRRATEQRGIWP